MITNIINNIVNKLINSDNGTLNRIGHTVHINHEMQKNRKLLITAPFDYGSSDRMTNILMEMDHVLNGGYHGNKEYLFDRMNYLISQGFECIISTLNTNVISVNNTPHNQLNAKLPNRNKKGQFRSKSTTSRKKKKQ